MVSGIDTALVNQVILIPYPPYLKYPAPHTSNSPPPHTPSSSPPHHHTHTARRAAAAARRAAPGRQCTCESERLAARASLCRNQVGSAFGQLALRRLVSAPTYAPRCPRLRPASANQPWGGFGPVLAGHLGLAFDTGAPSRSSARRRRPAAHRPRSSTTFSPRSCRRPKPS